MHLDQILFPVIQFVAAKTARMGKFRPIRIACGARILTAMSVFIAAFPCALMIFFIAKVRRSCCAV